MRAQHRQSNVAHPRPLAKLQRKPGEDGYWEEQWQAREKRWHQPLGDMTKWPRTQGNTTLLLHGRLPHKRKNPSNGHLRLRSKVTKDTKDLKGWPHPEGRQRRRNTVEGSPHNQAREEEAGVKDQHRPMRRLDSRVDPHKPKPTAAAWGKIMRPRTQSRDEPRMPEKPQARSTPTLK